MDIRPCIFEIDMRLCPLRLQGLWIKEMGLKAEDPVLVKCENGKLIITPDTSRAELVEAKSQKDYGRIFEKVIIL